MQKILRKLIWTMAIASTAVSNAAEIHNETIEAVLSYGVGTETGESMQGELELVPAIELALAPHVLMIGSARVRFDAYDKLEPGKPSFANHSTASTPVTLGGTGTVEIRDLYFELRSQNGQVRIGKQQIVWGRLDGIKVLDLVNPQDYREFILEDFGSSRISLWSAYFDYSFAKWRTEIAIIPDGTSHATPENGAWYEPTASRFRFGAAASQVSLPALASVPRFSLNNTAIGLRFSRRLGGMEFSAVAYSGKDPEPLGRISLAGNTTVVERFHDRLNAFGFSFDFALGAVVIRGEYAYQPERFFNLRSANRLTTRALDQHRGAIGMDIDGPVGVFINAQYLVDTIADALPGLVRPATDRIGTLYMRRAFAYDSLMLEARWYHSFTDKDQLVSMSIGYTLSDSTSVRLSADYSRGTPEGLFGQFAERDRITVSFRHIF